LGDARRPDVAGTADARHEDLGDRPGPRVITAQTHHHILALRAGRVGEQDAALGAWVSQNAGLTDRFNQFLVVAGLENVAPRSLLKATRRRLFLR
jgi:hypothetical protein